MTLETKTQKSGMVNQSTIHTMIAPEIKKNLSENTGKGARMLNIYYFPFLQYLLTHAQQFLWQLNEKPSAITEFTQLLTHIIC